MQNLPIFTKLSGRNCLVVGGGVVAARRIEQLLNAGGSVTVIAPECTETVREWAESGQISLIETRFGDTALDDYWLVVAATNDLDVNHDVARAAEAAKRFCNVVDEPELCTFIMPTIIDRDPITIAISSAGRSPVLARWIKGVLEETLPHRIGALAALAGRWRDRVKAALPDLDDRRRFWQTTLHGEVADLAYAGREEASEAALDAALERWLQDASAGPAKGQAYLVGAGPGDPELITLRARKLLARADAVLYDRLVNPRILEYARRDAELILVGKAAGKPSIRQEQLNRLLVNLVDSGKHVCRLKGGDPMVFGRAAEELEALAEAGLPFQVVPGVSAVEGCAAYAGIPLTMRDQARAVLIATGHTTDHDAADLTAYRPDQTLALYMAVANFGAISARLIELGHPRDLPLAVVENGTTEKQRVIRATLDDLHTLAEDHGVESPALLLVGPTVRYAERYGWFNPRIVEPESRDGLAEVI
ncbi:MAG TPA: siroheme synthase CysG [Gammaproteobacteria bacterium]|jgi:uroporphyrin-III C-methyltransferase/precorrin-2 dehydrogenase/sirohydrochlorin ferrochelatase